MSQNISFCPFFVFFSSRSHNRDPSCCGSPHSATTAIRLENKHECHFHTTFFKRQFSFPPPLFFKQRPRANEIRWGHGYLQGYKVCVGKWNLKQTKGRRRLMAADSHMCLMTRWEEMFHEHENREHLPRTTFLTCCPSVLQPWRGEGLCFPAALRLRRKSELKRGELMNWRQRRSCDVTGCITRRRVGRAGN